MPAPRALIEYFTKKTRYRRKNKLGEGGMAVVHQFLDEYFQRDIAYKKLKVEGALSAEEKQEFLREAEVMGRLEHPGIVTVHQMMNTEDGDPGITMNKVEGESLKECLNRWRNKELVWSESERLQAFARIVEVVDFAHSRGVLHRDLKPANIMIGPRGEITLLDWGLAKVILELDDSSRPKELGEGAEIDATMHGTIKGTPLYMSPEAALGRSDLIGPQLDIFSLGVILHEMLTGARLIPGKGAKAILANAAEANYDLSALKDCKINEDLQHIVRKAVKGDLERRYSSASLLREDIYAYLHGLSLRDFRSNPYHLFRKWMKRNQLSIVVLLIFVSVIGYGMVSLLKEISSRSHSLGKDVQRVTELNQRLSNLINEQQMVRQQEKLLDEKLNLLGNANVENLKLHLSLQSQKDELLRREQQLKFQLERDREIRNEVRQELARNESLLKEINQYFSNFKEKNVAIDRLKRVEMTLAMLPERGRRIQEAVADAEAGDPISALSALTEIQPPHLADRWLFKKISAQVKVLAGKDNGKPLSADFPPTTFLKELSARLPFPGQDWLQLHRKKDKLLIFAKNGSMLALTESQNPAEVMASHPWTPMKVFDAGEGIAGLYSPRRFFWQKDLHQPPQLLILPRPATSFSIEAEALHIACSGRDVIWTQSRPFFEQQPWLKSLGQKAPQPKEKPVMPLIPVDVLRKWGGSSGALAAMRNWAGFLHYPQEGGGVSSQRWKWSGGEVVEAIGGMRQCWLVMDGKGRVSHLAPGMPARPLVLERPVEHLFALHDADLGVMVDNERYLHLIFLSTGQYLYSLGQSEKELQVIYEDENGQVVMIFSGGQVFSLP